MVSARSSTGGHVENAPPVENPHYGLWGSLEIKREVVRLEEGKEGHESSTPGAINTADGEWITQCLESSRQWIGLSHRERETKRELRRRSRVNLHFPFTPFTLTPPPQGALPRAAQGLPSPHGASNHPGRPSPPAAAPAGARARAPRSPPPGPPAASTRAPPPPLQT